MDAYLEIALLPDPEFPPRMLMNALFSKLHRGLVAHGGGKIGVSFPDVGLGCKSLGERLRLHGAAADLDALMMSGWITGMKDHVFLGHILPVPSHAKHRVVRRVQAKSSPERERRRLMGRKNISVEAAKEAIPDSSAERLLLPFLTLASGSTGQQFRLFLEHLPVQEQAVSGWFSAYGLSPKATVPWF